MGKEADLWEGKAPTRAEEVETGRIGVQSKSSTSEALYLKREKGLWGRRKRQKKEGV